jgi:parallel beta-helix repeat protein
LGNEFNGIVVAAQSRPLLEENVCQDNGEAGIAFSEEGGGVARGNECSGNRVGIYLEGDAGPELVDNDCHDNSVVDVMDERK